jgi:hypothetical protein
MHIDCRHYPKGYAFAEVVSKGLGLYVKVADFVNHKGTRIFRLIVDPEIDKNQLSALLLSTVKDDFKTYEFAFLESIHGIVVDNGPTKSQATTYLRVTFM